MGLTAFNAMRRRKAAEAAGKKIQAETINEQPVKQNPVVKEEKVEAVKEQSTQKNKKLQTSKEVSEHTS